MDRYVAMNLALKHRIWVAKNRNRIDTNFVSSASTDVLTLLFYVSAVKEGEDTALFWNFTVVGNNRL